MKSESSAIAVLLLSDVAIAVVLLSDVAGAKHSILSLIAIGTLFVISMVDH